MKTKVPIRSSTTQLPKTLVTMIRELGERLGAEDAD